MAGSWFDRDERGGAHVSRFRALYASGGAPQPFTEADLERPLLARFLAHVAARPQQLALSCRRERMTYRELFERAAGLSEAIEQAGALDRPVGLMFEPCSLGIAAIVGSLFAARTYVPLDPAYPLERLRYMLHDCGAGLVLAARAHAGKARELAGGEAAVIEAEAVPALRGAGARELAVKAPAYVLYTSGSTGRPKGVVQSQRNVLFQVGSHSNNLAVSERDRLSLLSSLSFDAAVTDTFAALSNGAALVIADAKNDGFGRVRAALSEERVTIAHATPTVFRSLLASSGPDHVFGHVRCVVLGGEVLSGPDLDLFRRHFAPHCVLVNGYGATEVSFALQQHIAHGDATARDIVPIGYPLDGLTVELRDAAGQVDAKRGEITVSGPFLSPGYLGKPEQTAAAFVERPGVARGYRTGDIGERLADGSIQCVGRLGEQVKVRGHRVELGEIEARCRELPECVAVAVSKRADLTGQPLIVAYVVAGGDAGSCERRLRQHLEAQLPSYMLPARWVMLAALPLTPTGKIDYRALPEPPPVAPQASWEGPESETERAIMAAWMQVMASPIARQRNFFEAGATSLTIAMLHDCLAHRPVAPTVVQFYEHGNAAALAAHLDGTEVVGSDDDARALRRSERRARVRAEDGAPLSPEPRSTR